MFEALFQRSNIFPNDTTVARDFDPNFFWSQVKTPKAVGLDRDKAREEVSISAGKRALHNVLCVNEDVRFDLEDIDEGGELYDEIEQMTMLAYDCSYRLQQFRFTNNH
jgi:hypothetical protein